MGIFNRVKTMVIADIHEVPNKGTSSIDDWEQAFKSMEKLHA